MAENRQADRATTQAQPAPAANDLWVRCPGCREVAFRKEVERNLNICAKCGHHTRPYPQRMEQARRQSGRNDAIVTGVCKIEGRPTALAVMDFGFMGGSMGVAVGEKLARLFDRALKKRLPIVVFSSSGGARMQEGTLSLMQMAKVAAAIARIREAGLPYISIMCDPTTGGVAASFASLGDLNIAEPRAVIGFAGRRVIEQTTNQQLPGDFQTAEFLLAHGMLDAIVPRHKMRFTLAQLLTMLRPTAGRGGARR